MINFILNCSKVWCMYPVHLQFGQSERTTHWMLMAHLHTTPNKEATGTSATSTAAPKSRDFSSLQPRAATRAQPPPLLPLQRHGHHAGPGPRHPAHPPQELHQHLLRSRGSPGLWGEVPCTRSPRHWRRKSTVLGGMGGRHCLLSFIRVYFWWKYGPLWP